MRVHPSVAYQTHQMELAFRFCMAEGVLQHFVLCQFSGVYGIEYPLQFLEDHTSCTQVQMAYFTVTHLALGQSYKRAIRPQLRIRVTRIVAVHIGGLCGGNGTGCGILTVSPSVHDNEHGFLLCSHGAKVAIRPCCAGLP